MPLIADSTSFLLDIVGTYPLEHLAEQIELPVGVGGRGPCARSNEHGEWLRRQQRRPGTRDRTQENEGNFAHHAQSHSLVALRWYSTTVSLAGLWLLSCTAGQV